MSTFREISKEARPPGRTLVLEPWVWADEWEGRPSEAVCVGLRLMSEGDKSKGRAEAERLAFELHPNGGANWLDAFNDCLMRQVSALGICSPNDVKRPSEILPYAEEQVRFALNSRGAEFIFEAHRRYEIEASPLEPPVTDDEIDELCGRLGDENVQLTHEARKLLRYVLDELRAEGQ